VKCRVREIALGALLLAAMPSMPVSADPAEQTLLAKASYWTLNYRPDLAKQALDQLLSFDPKQPDALYQYGVIEAREGKTDQARRYLARLRDVAPSSPLIDELENTIRIGRIDPIALNEARRLVKIGDFEQAAQKYRQLFGGRPPPNYALEYYQTLAGTPDGWDEARQAIAGLVQASGGEPHVKLAYAQVLTYREPSRREGILLLIQLSRSPIVGAAAMRSWREALLWLNAKVDDKGLYDQYLAQNPQDSDVQKYFAEAITPPPAAPADVARFQGFTDLQHGDSRAAERAFAKALLEHPGDADALGGLGVIRLRQRRFGEARDLLSRAMRASPSTASHWVAAYQSASFWAGIQEAKAAQAAGDYKRARSILSGLVGRSGKDNWNAELALGAVDAKLGDLDKAEQAYRRVLATRPHDGDAILGLVNVLVAQGKAAEASTLLASLPTTAAARQDNIKRARADILRTQAKDLQGEGRNTEARAKFEQALAIDPTNPWLRLDFANFLDRQGELPQAFAIMNPSASGNTPESVEAAAMFDVQQNRFADALDKINRIPAAERTSDINAYRDQILLPAQIERAKRLAAAGRRAEARDVLIALYRQPPIEADKTRTVVYQLSEMGETNAALAIARESIARGGPDATKATIDYAATLLKSNHYGEASAALKQLRSSGRLDADDQADADHLAAIIGAHQADKLRKEGEITEAKGQISTLLGAHPNDPTLLMAAGRIYAAAGDRKQALSYIDSGYQQSPTDPQIVNDAVWSAIQANDLDRARTYLAKALEDDPKNPQLYYLRAQVERYSGNLRAAVQSLEKARSLNSEQAGGSPARGPGSSATPISNNGQDSNAQLLNSARGLTAQPSAARYSPGAAALHGGTAGGLPAPLPDSGLGKSLLVPPNAGDRPLPNGSIAPQSSAEDDLMARRQAAQLRAAQAFTIRVAQASGPSGLTQVASLGPVSTPTPLSDASPPQATSPATGAPSGTLNTDIDRSLAEIEAQSAPIAAAGPILRIRAGNPGLDKLINVQGPIETSFSPWYTGRAYFGVTPTFLRAGTPSSSGVSQFGTNPLLAVEFPGSTLPSPGDQQANGVGLYGGYSYKFVSAAIGTSPIGFPVRNLLGDIALCYPFACGPIGPAGLSLWEGSPSNPFQLRVEGQRQPVTDTLLSFAGTRDPATQQVWGGVAKTSGHAVLLYDNGSYGGIATGGGGVLDGQNVKSNSEGEGLIGAFFRPWREGDNALKVGLDLAYFGYDRNLQFFSFGQGGYFSPQNYLNLSLPIEYSGRDGALSYRAAAAIGVIHFNEDRSPFFPTNANAQTTMQSLTGNNAFYPGKIVTVPGFNVGGQVEYAFDNGLTLGGRANVNNTRDYTEGMVNLYLRDNFGIHTLPVFSPDVGRGSL